MNRTPYLLILLLLLALLLAAGCAPPPAAQAALQATATPSAMLGEQGTPQAADDTSTEPVAQMTVEPEPADNFCIECHSDAELLQDIAFQPTAVPSLNEGSG